jgi:phosphate transport system permease protein
MTDTTANLPPPALDYARSRSLSNRTARFANIAVVSFCWFSALMTIAALFFIFGYIVFKGFSSLNLALFTKLPGVPLEPTDPNYVPTGLRNCIAGTMVLIGLASIGGVPIGMLCGIYLAEYARDNWFSHFIRLVVDVVAGVPSIIVGLLGYELAVVRWDPYVAAAGQSLSFFQGFANVFIKMHNFVFPGGFSAWAGAIALAFLMCPIIARTTEEMLKLVPKSLREASVGLGGSRYQTLFRVVIPTASSGIITGVMLAVARVAGETAPLLFTILGSNQEVFTSSKNFPYFMDLRVAFPSLTIQIFKYSGSAEPEWKRQAWAGMLILIVIVLVLNICVRIASSRKKFKAA